MFEREAAGDQPTTGAEEALKVLLRVIGTSSLLALIFVVAPEDWMVSIHAELGMGDLPREPVVGYLARSTSAIYAMLGGLFWLISFDPRRHRTVLTYFGCAIPVLGVALFFIDRTEGLPLAWTLWEGPALIVFGLTILFCSRALPRGRPTS